MLVIASDHGGFALKQELMEHLRQRGVEFEDIGTYTPESCNYPEYAEKAARGKREEAEKQQQFERRQQKRKEKHRGH